MCPLAGPEEGELFCGILLVLAALLVLQVLLLVLARLLQVHLLRFVLLLRRPLRQCVRQHVNRWRRNDLRKYVKAMRTPSVLKEFTGFHRRGFFFGQKAVNGISSMVR